VGNHEEHYVPKESVKAAELGECNMNAVAYVTLNPHRKTLGQRENTTLMPAKQ